MPSQVSALRQAVRQFKRSRLEARLRTATGEQVKEANAVLNWREFWHGMSRLHSRPRLVQVGTNWTCNLKCNFCRLTLPETQKTLKALPPRELEISPRVFDEVMELMPYPEMITLTPLGEPLLYSKFGKMLERHASLGSRNLAMTTNGNLINDDRARMIVEGGMNHLFVSVDARDPDIYRELRVRGELDKVEAALEAINRWKDKLASKSPAMTLASTFMKRNVREMPEMVDFALKHRFQSYSVQLMEVENKDLESEFLGHHIAETKAMVLETLKRAEGTGLDVRIHLALKNLLSANLTAEESRKVAANTDQAGLESISTKGKSLKEKCHYPWYFLVIDTDGDCRPCCWTAMSFGNLNELSFDEIWNSESAQGMRRDFLDNRIPKVCQGKHCRVDLDHFGTLE